MLQLTPIDPPRASVASLCRQFGQALAVLGKDALRIAWILGALWLAEQLLGFHL